VSYKMPSIIIYHQEAIEASMRDMSGGQAVPPQRLPLEGEEAEAEEEEESELARAIRLSQELEQQRQDQLRREEDEMLAKVLALSLQEQ
jgi:Ubiquitin interaction motif